MAVLVRDLFWGVSVDLGDHKPQFVRFTARELVRAYNEAQAAICELLPSNLSRLCAIKLQPGTLQSIDTLATSVVKPAPTADLRGLQFIELLRNMGTDGETPGRVISVVGRDTLDALDPSWHTKTGTVVRSFTHDPRFPKHFMVEPGVPTDSNVWVQASFTAMPAKLANPPSLSDTNVYKVDGTSDAVMGLPDEYENDVHAYMVARLSMKESKWADPAKGERFTMVFTSSMNSKVKAQTGTNPNLKRLPFSPPEPLTAAQ